MNVSTKGIVLHRTKYTDSSFIVKIFTERLGLQTYLVQGANRKSAKIKSNLLQPFTLLDLEVYQREKKDIQRIKELRLDHPFESIPFDQSKNAIALFLTEILYKTVKEEAPNPELFQFLDTAIRWLDLSENPCANFHLWFLVQLSGFFGFFPQGTPSETIPRFDLREGCFCENIPHHQLFLDRPYSFYLYRLLGTKIAAISDLRMSGNDRKILLNGLVDYFRIHLDQLKEIRSHQVLETVLA